MEKIVAQNIGKDKINSEYNPIEIKEGYSDYYKDYQYGQSIEKLNANIAIRNMSKETKYSYGIYGGITTNGDIAVTTGFTPKLIKFTAIYSNTTSSAMSIGQYVNGDNNCTVLYDQSADYSAGTYCFMLSATDGLGKVTATSTTGFTLNVANAGLITYTVMYECFG